MALRELVMVGPEKWKNGVFTLGGFSPTRICLAGPESDKMVYIPPNELWPCVRMEEGHFLMLGHDPKCLLLSR